MQLLDKEITTGVHAKVEIVNAKLVFELSGDAEAVAAKVKEMIPGAIDDAIIDAGVAVLKAATPAVAE